MAEAEHQAKKHLLMEEAVRARKNYEKRAYVKKQNADFMAARVRFNVVDVIGDQISRQCFYQNIHDSGFMLSLKKSAITKI